MLVALGSAIGAGEGVMSDVRLYLGSYGDAAVPRIRSCRLEGASGTLRVLHETGGVASPSFLALNADGRRLYAVSEAGGGSVVGYAVADDGALSELNRQACAGGPCHLLVAPGGKAVIAANYGAGSVACLGLDADGRLRPAQVIQHTGSGAKPKRQAGPHAHGVAVLGDTILVADLGIDRLVAYRLTDATLAAHGAGITTAPGAGPRHIAVSADGKRVYVVNELDNTVAAWTWDATSSTPTPLGTAPTLPASFTGSNSTAEIALSPDGRFLYASNRGHDSIAVLRLDADGRPQPAGHIPSGGKSPRSFALSPDGAWLVSANQDSDNVVVMRRDATTGLATPVGQPLTVPKPVCVLFVLAR